MTGKRRIFLAGGILLLGGLIYILQSGWLKETARNWTPRLTVTGIRINEIHADSVQMDMVAVFDNTTPIGLRVDSIVYDFFIDSVNVMESTYPDKIQIEAGDTTSVSLPITMRYNELGNKLQELENKGSDSALYRIEAIIFANVVPGGKFDVVLEQRLPLIRIPEISMAGVEIDEAGLSGATMIVNIRVRNKNAFGFGFKNIAYELAIGENQPVKGDKAEDLYFPARDSTAVSIPFQLDPVEAGKSLIDWIGAGDDLTYQFALTAEIVSEQRFFRDSKIAMEADGTFGELEKAIRKGTENE